MWDARIISTFSLPKYLMNGGEGGIRTPGPLSRSTVFKTAALNHSATSPAGIDHDIASTSGGSKDPPTKRPGRAQRPVLRTLRDALEAAHERAQGVGDHH